MDAQHDTDRAAAGTPAVGEGPRTAEKTSASADGAFRDVSPRWLAALKVLVNVLYVAPLLGGLFLGYDLASQYGLLWSLLAIVLPGWLLALAIHEFGHWWAARWRGMLVSTMAIAFWEIQPRRRGVRVRRLRATRIPGARGYVIAHPDPDRDVRLDLIWLSLGGPLANLLAAAACLLAAWWLRHSPAETIWLVWGMLHCIGFVFNLIPQSLPNGRGSDGLNLSRLLLNRFEDLPGSEFVLLQSRLLRGVAAVDLPPELLHRLASKPAPMPALLDWLNLCTALNAWEIDEAAARFEAVRERIEGYDEPIRLGLSDVLTIAGADLAFARAVVRGDRMDLAALDALNWKAPVFWYDPQLPLRVRALAAALRGDAALARALLARSKRYADNSSFVSTVSTETKLRARVEAIIERGVPGAGASSASIA